MKRKTLESKQRYQVHFKVNFHFLVLLFIALIAVGLNGCWSQEEPQPRCPPFGEIAFGMPGHCDRFIRCVEGFRTFNSCPRNAVFDIVTGTCNVENVANQNCRLHLQCADLNLIRPNQYSSSSRVNNGSMSKF